MKEMYGGNSSLGKTILKIVAVVLCAIAFALMFTHQCQVYANGERIKSFVLYDDCLFSGLPVLSFIGYILVLVGGLVGIVSIFMPAQSKLLTIAAMAAVAVAAVLIGLVSVFWKASNLSPTTDWNTYKLAAGPIVACVFGAVSAGLLGLCLLIKDVD